MRSCWRRRRRRGPGTRSSISAPGWVRPVWRWRRAFPVSPGHPGRNRPGAGGAGRRKRPTQRTCRPGARRSCSTWPHLRARSLRPDLAAELATRVMMNPPFNDPARQRTSPEPARRLAHALPPEAPGALGADGCPAAAAARHVEPDLAGRRRRRGATRARTRRSVRFWFCRCIRSRRRRPSGFWCGRPNRAGRRSPAARPGAQR